MSKSDCVSVGQGVGKRVIRLASVKQEKPDITAGLVPAASPGTPAVSTAAQLTHTDAGAGRNPVAETPSGSTFPRRKILSREKRSGFLQDLSLAEISLMNACLECCLHC